MQVATTTLSPGVQRKGKLLLRWPRYALGLKRARQNWKRFGDRYQRPVLFVAGLPKSGTSWMESMLAGFPGYTLIAHPEITVHDYDHQGTHGFEMPDDFFTRLGDALCVVKIHCHGSENNVSVLRRSGVPYCVLYRDLRDAAVSHVSYVKRTPWHPEYPVYESLDLPRALRHFADTLLPEWADWIDSWRRNRDPSSSIELRYEDMLVDTPGTMKRVAALFRLPERSLDGIVEENDFQKIQGSSSFYRKGRAGDWVNHFDDELTRIFDDRVGDRMAEWGYA